MRKAAVCLYVYSTSHTIEDDMQQLMPTLRSHQRRLVINIGGQKFGTEILGGQKFRENIFSDNIIKKIF